MYTRKDDLGELLPVPVKLVHINKCPVLAPAATLSEQRADELGIDRARCRISLDQLRQHPEIREKLTQVFATEREHDSSASRDAELSLYEGFFNDNDKNTMELVRKATPEQLASTHFNFVDKRLSELLFRYRARNFPASLLPEEQRRWQQHCADYLMKRADGYTLQLEQLYEQYANDNARLSIIKALAIYLQSL